MARDAWGIEDGYWDIAGRWHDTSEPTRRALRVAMGGLRDVADPPPTSRAVWFVRRGAAPAIERPAELVLEDGTHVTASKALPPDLPLGYHDLLPSDGGPVTRLIVAPDRCHLPEGLRTWGWYAQLYATRSRQSWGIGDLGDLAALGRWATGLGAGVLGINPLHAPQPGPQQDPSP
ncbi:MAG: 4-alpha-glucanotransferase, partial [Acidimicrobiaceae bacterium]